VIGNALNGWSLAPAGASPVTCSPPRLAHRWSPITFAAAGTRSVVAWDSPSDSTIFVTRACRCSRSRCAAACGSGDRRPCGYRRDDDDLCPRLACGANECAGSARRSAFVAGSWRHRWRQKPEMRNDRPVFWLVIRGGQGRDRTADLPLFRRTLVPTELPAPSGDLAIATSAVPTGFEPAASTLTGWRALQAAPRDHGGRAPNGIRTRATALKGRRPRPLDDEGGWPTAPLSLGTQQL
jgi:hypothetical protein